MGVAVDAVDDLTDVVILGVTVSGILSIILNFVANMRREFRIEL